ncbi:MAG: ParB/RepB/Spo0J family partition protein [Luminiphilus sp.]|jgi:ParB family transcriptional regulator, chromosome partitioning protein|nr:ParB/RepB/Spo0J family partition protein [Luminiphilus sp.]
MAQKRKLNRGLEALLGSGLIAKPKPEAEDPAQPVENKHSPVTELPIEKLQRGVYQPRRKFDHDALKTLADSISAQGILQPIVVRPVDESRFEILSGERRWRAAQLAALDRVPVVVKDVSNEAAVAIALIENIQREDLNPVEEGLGLKRLQDEFGLSQEQIARAVGRSRPAVANLLRLLNLQSEVLAMLERRELEAGHAKVLLALEGGDQVRAAQQVLKRGLSVRQTEAVVRGWGSGKPPAAGTDPNISRLEQDLSDRFGAKVRIQHQQSGRGRLEIHYTTLEELDGVLKRFD